MAFKEQSYYSLHDRGQHRIYYNDWGDENGQPLLCVHGLTGNAHDFDFLAEDLIKNGYRVIAVDLPGRGRSDFHTDPTLYSHDQYIRDLHELLNRLGLDQPHSVDWLGISLGGLLGIRMAGMENTPINRLLINDVAPSVPQAALDFIHQVISQTYNFDTVNDLEQRMRATRGLTWGPVTDKQWHHMAEHNARALDDGKITYAYDPQIAVIFENEPIGGVDLWQYWDMINRPTLVVQGAESLLLTDDLIEQMKKRGPDFDHLVFEGCGHVPSLMAPEQIEQVRTWLQQ